MTRVEMICAYTFAALVGLVVGVCADKVITARPAAVSADPLVAAGQTYKTELGQTYGVALGAGARVLDSGAGVESALATVSTSWANGRTQVYRQTILPVLAKIVPEGTADADVTAAQRARMAAAFRSLATGLSQ